MRVSSSSTRFSIAAVLIGSDPLTQRHHSLRTTEEDGASSRSHSRSPQS
jgi:hypothetical protein